MVHPSTKHVSKMKQKNESNEQTDRYLIFNFVNANLGQKLTKQRHEPMTGLKRKVHSNNSRKGVTVYDLQDDLDEIANEAKIQCWNDQYEDLEDDECVENQCVPLRFQLIDCFMTTNTKAKNKKRKSEKNPEALSAESVNHKEKKVYCFLADKSQSEEQFSFPTEVYDLEMNAKISESHEKFIVMDPVRIKFRKEELHPTVLRSLFDDRYIESDSVPRKLAIKLIKATEQNVKIFVFLIFEEVACGEVDSSEWNVFLNADVFDVERLSLGCAKEKLPESDVNFLQFVTFSTHFVFENLSQNLIEREGITVLNFRVPSLFLTDEEPSILKLPLRIDSWKNRCDIKSERFEEMATSDQEMEVDEAMVVVNATCKICKVYVEVDSVVCVFDECATFFVTAGTCMSSCRHFVCNKCWSLHLTNGIRRNELPLCCPVKTCRTAVDIVTILRFVPLQLLMANWHHLETKRELLDERAVLCPNSTCGHVIRVKQIPASNESFTVLCSCHHQFCLTCREEAHWPVSCHMYHLFKTKMTLSRDWDVVNNLAQPVSLWGKRCPSCDEFIQRHGGHYIMTCKCGERFCWRCLSIIREEVRVYLPSLLCWCRPTEGAKNRFRKEAPLEKMKVGPLVGPTPSRSRAFWEILKWRSKRLRMRMNPTRLKQMLYKEKHPRHNSSIYKEIEKESSDIIRRLMEIFRVVEFCYLAAFMINKSNGASICSLKDCARSLLLLAKRIREVLNGKGQGSTHQQLELVQSSFKQARKKFKELQNMKALRDESAIRHQV